MTFYDRKNAIGKKLQLYSSYKRKVIFKINNKSKLLG